MRKGILLFAAVIFFATTKIFSQSFSINNSGASAHPSAMLDVSSTTKGVLVPRMTKAQKNAITSPATGLLVFQDAPDSVGFYYYNGSSWLWLATATSNAGWLTTGNSGTDSALNFLGTLDDKPLMLRQNNLWMGQLNTRNHTYFIGAGAGRNNSAAQNTGFGDSALYNNTTGIGNTAIGYRSMLGSGPITGSINTAIGNNTLSNITTGFQNVAIGDNAMYNMKTGGLNVVIGPGAMESATKGNDNIAMGLWALRGNDSGNANIALGHSALYSNDSSSFNTAVGYQTLYFNQRDANTALGHYAGIYNSYLQTDLSLGVENTYVGYISGYYANTGSKNVAMGHRALQGPGFFGSNSPGNIYYKRNVAIGDSSMVLAYGSDNVGIGYKTLSKSDFTSQHTAVGSRALMNTTGSYPNTAIGYSSMDSATTATANTAVGSYSLTSIKTGLNNTAIGNAAMYEAVGTSTNLSNNTAVGNNALRKAKYFNNTAIGADVLSNDTSGTYNAAMGYGSMYNNINGQLNTALGASAMFFAKTGDRNVALGYAAMFNNDSSNENTAVGYFSLFNHRRSGNAFNTAVGAFSLEQDTIGYYNTGLGVSAFRNNINGFSNTGVGTNAGYYQKKYQNTFVGAFAGVGERLPGSNYAADSGYNNTGVGAYAMERMANGIENTAVGYRSLLSDSTGDYNTAVGASTLNSNLASHYNTAMGYNALYNHQRTGNSYNTGLGSFALEQDSIGYYNVGVGTSAFRFNITGNHNTGLGTNAGYYQKNSYNTYMGAYTGFGERFPSTDYAADTGIYNTGLGAFAMYSIASGHNNVAIGYNALYFDSSGSRNVSIGRSSMSQNTTGDNNIGIGYGALNTNTTGTLNTALGYNADVSSAALSNAAAIGSNAYVAQSNSLVLGSINGTNTATADTKVGIGTTTPDSLFSVTDNFMVNKSGEIQYSNPAKNMMYMFQSGSNNANRMVIAHSPAFTNYGLQYKDVGDAFVFLGNGNPVMTIELAGQQVGIGMTPTTQLELSLNSAQKPTSSTWLITSDERMKTVNGQYTRGLQDVLKLNTIVYHYKPGNSRGLPIDETGYGFTAQQVQRVFPEAVRTGKDGLLSLDMHPILVSYVNAFKEQQQQIDELKKQNEQLLLRLEKLEQKQ